MSWGEALPTHVFSGPFAYFNSQVAVTLAPSLTTRPTQRFSHLFRLPWRYLLFSKLKQRPKEAGGKKLPFIYYWLCGSIKWLAGKRFSFIARLDLANYLGTHLFDHSQCRTLCTSFNFILILSNGSFPIPTRVSLGFPYGTLVTAVPA